MILTMLLLAGCSPQSPAAAQRALRVAPDGGTSAIATSAFEIAAPAEFTSAYVRFEGGAPSPAPGPDTAEVDLVGGERLVGTVVGGGEERFEVRIAGDVRVPADLDHLAALRFPARLSGAAVVEPAPEGDRLYRAQSNGVERIDGAVEGFGEAGIRFHGELVGSIAIPWRNVGALFVEHLGGAVRARDPAAVPVVVDLADGSRLGGDLRAVRGGWIELDRRGEPCRLPLGTTLQIARDDGSVAFLSAWKPSSAEPARPFGDDLGMQWPVRVDHSVDGGPLRAGGARHPRGLGVHAPSRVTYALDGAFARLDGAVAIDDAVSKLATRGSCVFRVLLDGREVWASPRMRAGEEPRPFRVELGAARELALVADPTDDGFAGDRANWLGLVATRAQPPSSR